PFRSLIPALAQPRKKNYTSRKKTRQPCVYHVASRSPHSATLHCGLSASATLAPLADGSRLSTTQAKNQRSGSGVIFCPLRFGSRLFYLRCFCATPTPTPDHPPLFIGEIFILFALPRRLFLFARKKGIRKNSNYAYRQ
ncbi:MAG: hypothetical protein LBR55_01425, partial [Bacteroidales bacterium]|nr:hypothetical protein [Bacteroidales bacterium]